MQKFYYHLVKIFPWILFLGILQQSYWNYLPGFLQTLLQGKEYWDRWTIIDFYLVVLFFILCFLLFQRKISFLGERKLPMELKLSLFFLFFAGFLEIFFQEVFLPVLSSPLEYFRSLIFFPIGFSLLWYKTLPPLSLKKLERHYFGMISAVSLFALGQFFFQIFPGEAFDFLHRLTWPYLDFLTLKASSANWLAFLMTPPFLLSGLKFFQESQTGFVFQKNKLILLTFFLSGIVLYLTQSYGAFVAIASVLIFYFFMSLPWRKFLIALGILLIFGGGVYFLQKQTFKYQILTGTTEKPYRYANSLESRSDILKMNAYIVREKFWLGVGLNQYQSYFQAKQKEALGHIFQESQIPPHAHNFFLSFWTSLGFFGFLGMIILTLSLILRSRFSPLNPAFFVFGAILIHGLIDAYYWKPEIAYIFWMIIFMAYNNIAIKSQK